jgi:hypothetical protein
MKQFLILALFVMGLPVFAENIYLNDGTVITGDIIEMNTSIVRVKKSYGVIEIGKDQIKKITYGQETVNETVKTEEKRSEPQMDSRNDSRSFKFMDDQVDITRTPDYLVYKRTRGIGLGLTIPGSIIFGVSTFTMVMIAASFNVYFPMLFMTSYSAPWMVFDTVLIITGLILMISGLANLGNADKILKEIVEKYADSGLRIESGKESLRVGWAYRF